MAEGGGSSERWDSEPGRLGRADLGLGPRVRRRRRIYRVMPSPPRCKMCNSPFGPPGGPVLRLFGKGPWPGNPKFCSRCFRDLYTHRAGADIDCSLIFADIRGSTSLAESMPVADFRELLDRFYAISMEVLIEHEAIVDSSSATR